MNTMMMMKVKVQSLWWLESSSPCLAPQHQRHQASEKSGSTAALLSSPPCGSPGLRYAHVDATQHLLAAHLFPGTDEMQREWWGGHRREQEQEEQEAGLQVPLDTDWTAAQGFSKELS